MKSIPTLCWSVAVLATVGMCFPSAAFSSTLPTPNPKVADVALTEGGTLVGQVVTADGLPVRDMPVLLQDQRASTVELKTNKDGYFAAKNVSPGVYRLAAADEQGVYRLWAPKTAPPTAQKGALLVAGDEVARGQHGNALRNMLANPWIVGGIVAAAIAIPVAVHNSGKHSPTSP